MEKVNTTSSRIWNNTTQITIGNAQNTGIILKIAYLSKDSYIYFRNEPKTYQNSLLPKMSSRIEKNGKNVLVLKLCHRRINPIRIWFKYGLNPIYGFAYCHDPTSNSTLHYYEIYMFKPIRR